MCRRVEEIKRCNKEGRTVYHLKTEYWLAKHAPCTFGLLGELFY